MKKIAFITGKLGGYMAMLPMIKLFGERAEVLAVDQHLRAQFGERVHNIPSFAYLHGFKGLSERLVRMPLLFECFSQIRAGQFAAIIVYGDRADAVLGAVLGLNSGVPVAHLQAGDVSGGIDDSQRWATSLLSTWLFAPTTRALVRLEHRCRSAKSYMVGDHHLDALRIVRDAIKERDDLEPPNWAVGRHIIHLHPDTLKSADENREMTRDVIRWYPDAVWLTPCNDPGHEVILDELQAHQIHPRPYMPQIDYVRALLASEGLVGNSSAVVIDAPFLGVPTTIIGNRQANRIGEGDRGDGYAGQRTYEILVQELGE